MTNTIPARAAFGTIRCALITNSLALIMMLAGTPGAFAQNAGANAKPGAGAASSTKPAAGLTPDAEAALQKKVESYLRNIYAWGDGINVKPGPLTPAPIGG